MLHEIKKMMVMVMVMMIMVYRSCAESVSTRQAVKSLTSVTSFSARSLR